ncbi:YphA family membrane protein [Alteribacter populi]|uniref:YphA family membrane protein n=1 Tax=Alteribacter populi TaxID=2011011 RepID=UPI000BBB0D70|nr:hypothetical protein [Alteribacter populi]
MGFWFFWVMWLLVICIYFFSDKKSSVRVEWIIVAFAILILANVTIPFFGFGVNLAMIVIAWIGYKTLIKVGGAALAIGFFISLLLSALFGWLQFVYYYEPVWMLFTIQTSTVALFSLILILIGRTVVIRIAVLSVSFFQGEIGFTFFLIMTGREVELTIGSFQYLDMLALTFLVVLGWSLIEWFAAWLKQKVYSSFGVLPAGQRKLNA